MADSPAAAGFDAIAAGDEVRLAGYPGQITCGTTVRDRRRLLRSIPPWTRSGMGRSGVEAPESRNPQKPWPSSACPIPDSPTSSGTSPASN
jgi:hypothetical protein